MKLLVALLLSILLFSGCSKNKRDLSFMAEEKDSEGLIEFISDNIQNEEKKDLVEFAIEQIISKDLKPGKEFIEKMIREGNSKTFTDKAISSYSENNSQFESVDSMLANYFLVIDRDKDAPYLKTYRSVLTSGDRKLMAGKIRNSFIKFIERSDLKLSASAVDLLVKSLEFRDSLSTRMNFLVTKSLQLSGNEKDSFKTYVEKIYIRELQDSIENYYSNKRSVFSDEWNSRNPEPESFGSSDIPSEAFYLSGYIVGKSSSDSYEVIVPGQTYRALVTTNYTSYTTKGTFSLPVKKTGTEMVTVKEEFGGFTQEWNTYTEVKPEEVKRWQAYKNREVLQAQYESLKARTLVPVLEGMEKTEKQEIEKLSGRKNEFAKMLVEQFESYKKEIRENYKECFIL